MGKGSGEERSGEVREREVEGERERSELLRERDKMTDREVEREVRTDREKEEGKSGERDR